MAIAPGWTARHDRRRIGITQIDEPMVDQRANAFGGERLGVVHEYTIGPSAGTGDHVARPLHYVFGDPLGLADVRNLLLVLAAAIEHSQLAVALHAHSRSTDEVGEDQRQGTIPDNPRNTRTPQALGRCLRRGRLTISRQAAFGRIIGGAGNLVNSGVAAGPIHFNIPEDQQRFDASILPAKLEIDHLIERPRIEFGGTRPRWSLELRP